MAKWAGMKRFLLSSFSLLILLVFSACSNFDARFAKGVQGTRKDDRFSGTYAGRWMSSSHPGGEGKLWCILSKLENIACGHAPRGSVAYMAEFKATWHGIHMSEHSVVLHTKPVTSGKGSASGARNFTGTAVLKTFIGAGTYHCEGSMDGARMRACYDATYDRGTFELVRVKTPGTRQ